MGDNGIRSHAGSTVSHGQLLKANQLNLHLSEPRLMYKPEDTINIRFFINHGIGNSIRGIGPREWQAKAPIQHDARWCLQVRKMREVVTISVPLRTVVDI